MDEDNTAEPRVDGDRATALGAPREAAAPAVVRHDDVPGHALAKAGLGRALAELGIEHFPSYSPEARGRMERVFWTLRQRLLPLLRLRGITTIEAATPI